MMVRIVFKDTVTSIVGCKNAWEADGNLVLHISGSTRYPEGMRWPLANIEKWEVISGDRPVPVRSV